ncbi:hypothetical protein Tsubulata_014422 [Turnera subulata]|uniref:Uncharacterized protein n=1 Tax=Turnera subulata TaxID=218843 RepID=A0A9Q0FJN0_9ROSI|nr:hypothetical protein Tsubulata_014422 [Turnera subulata]
MDPDLSKFFGKDSKSPLVSFSFRCLRVRGRGKGAQCDVIEAPIGLCSKEPDERCASTEHGGNQKLANKTLPYEVSRRRFLSWQQQ